MQSLKTISSKEFENFTVNIHEPFAKFLMADEDEYSFKISLPESWVSNSKLYPVVAQVAPTIASFFGDFLPFFKETFSQF